LKINSKVPLRVERALRTLLKALRGVYGDAEIYLFGSYARGCWLEDSDVDIIVVSDGFKEMSLPKRVGEVRRLAPKDTAFEILAYTPQELKEILKKSTVIQDAATYWRKIA